MPTTAKPKSVKNLRHIEYYGMQKTFDELYARSLENESFDNLMEIVLARENILLAYRNIKGNAGSVTPGTDGLNIKDIGNMTAEEVVDKVSRILNKKNKWGYRPKPVRRKEIPKPYDPTKTRPLGIPCIWDRLIQQCIKQVMEPICEAKFSQNSYGFRPLRSVENAISASYNRMQRTKMHYVIEFDIKGFFDNVNHTKLLRQIWAMGIRDKHLIFILRRILTAPIKMPDGKMVYPDKGTPQGGIISPLLANIVLNELDQWVDSQWQNNPVARKYSIGHNKNGLEILSSGYRAMRNTRLKEMYIIRYADDFRIFCRSLADARSIKAAVTDFIESRLKLEVSEEKTKIVNVKRRYSDFLGFKMRVVEKSKKLVVTSHIADKQQKRIRDELREQADNIVVPRPGKTEKEEIRLYNSMVMGIHNYYCIATRIYDDCTKLHWAMQKAICQRLRRNNRLAKKGRQLTEMERAKYGHTSMLRYASASKEPIYPIGSPKHRHPMGKQRTTTPYTEQGRTEIHDNLRVNTRLMGLLMKQPLHGRSAEYVDNRISLFSAQWGKCSITKRAFIDTESIHCHHIKPKNVGGDDKYENLTLVLEPVHRLIHARETAVIEQYMEILQLNKNELEKINNMRVLAGNTKICV